jgi:NAD(P)H dehydrogenase (quinone)
MGTMKKIAVIYYSRTGNTKKMAEMIIEGVKSGSGIEADLFSVEDFPVDKALEYDGIIIGSPTYYATMAAPVKDFFDKTVEFHGSLDGKVGAAFSSAANIGGGNETTITDIINAMLVHGMIVQGNPAGDHFGPVSIGKPDARVQKQCMEMGKRTAALVKRVG